MAAMLRRVSARGLLRPRHTHGFVVSLSHQPCQLRSAIAWPRPIHSQRWMNSSPAEPNPFCGDRSAKQAEEEFKDADTDGDGVISPDELHAFIEKKSKPTIAVAMAMPREPWEMPNEVLVLMAARGDPGAQVERMAREIMAVDQVSWEAAQPKLAEIRSAAIEGRTRNLLPYYVAVVISSLCVACCLPLTFDHDTALWFNEKYVTADVPPEKDLETWLEVGGWTWNWVEPVIGIASFVLLLLQFSRAQLLNVRWTPYFKRIKLWKLKSVRAAYPQYNAYVLDGFLESVYK